MERRKKRSVTRRRTSRHLRVPKTGKLSRRHLLRLIERAVEERRYLLRISDVVGYAVGFREREKKRTDEPVLTVYVQHGRKGKKPEHFARHQRIPRTIRMPIGRGRSVVVGVDLIETGAGKIGAGGAASSASPIQSGLSVGNRKVSDNTGTLGWIARRAGSGDPVICGSCHVLLRLLESNFNGTGVEKRYSKLSSKPEFVMSPSLEDHGSSNSDIVGVVEDGLRDHRVDVAIASVNQPSRLRKAIKDVGPMGKARFLRSDELKHDPPVRASLCGRTSGACSGQVTEYPATFGFDYPDAQGLIMVSDLIATDISTQGGDSGSLLVDDARRPIGMLLGSGGKRSFFIHIANIIDAMDLKEY